MGLPAADGVSRRREEADTVSAHQAVAAGEEEDTDDTDQTPHRGAALPSFGRRRTHLLPVHRHRDGVGASRPPGAAAVCLARSGGGGALVGLGQRPERRTAQDLRGGRRSAGQFRRSRRRKAGTRQAGLSLRGTPSDRGRWFGQSRPDPGQRRLALSHSAHQARGGLAVRRQSRRRTDPRPPDRPQRVECDRRLQSLCGSAARLCGQGSPWRRAA